MSLVWIRPLSDAVERHKNIVTVALHSQGIRDVTSYSRERRVEVVGNYIVRAVISVLIR